MGVFFLFDYGKVSGDWGLVSVKEVDEIIIILIESEPNFKS